MLSTVRTYRIDKSKERKVQYGITTAPGPGPVPVPVP